MYSLEELKQQNRDIADLCAVLSVLVEHGSLRNNPYVCDLVSRFREKVWMHLVFEDNTLYAELLGHGDDKVNEIASRFHDSARAVKKRFAQYVRNWCHVEAQNTDHDRFVRESREIFRLIMDRVKYENEEMFPLLAQRTDG